MMLKLFGNKTGVPAEGPADNVMPLHFFDDTPVWRSFILYSMFAFDDVLDAEKLRSGLERLVFRKGWEKLGARLRKDNKGALEYHFPAEFTKDRPALSYSQVIHDMKRAEHPLASRLPQPSARPAVVGDPDEFEPLFRCEGGPTKLDDYLNKDIPQLGLHIVSFNDATLVCLYWPHTMFDALGKKALLKAWSLMIQGRDDEVLPPFGSESDPFTELGKHPTEKHVLTDKRLSTFNLVHFGVSHIVEFVWRSQETRMVCIPRYFIERLKRNAIDELPPNEKGEKPFLSEGDVLCGWWTKIAIAHLSQTSNVPVVLNNAYSIRNVLKGDIIPEGREYLSNAIAFVNVMLTSKDVFEKPVSYVAWEIRKAIKETGTRQQIEAFEALVRESGSKLPPFFGEPSMHMVTYSNWGKAKLFETDFAAAIMPGGTLSPSRTSTPGKPTYIQNNQFGMTMPNAFPVMGKDNEGNIWMSGYLNKGLWAKIEEILAQMA